MQNQRKTMMKFLLFEGRFRQNKCQI